MKTQGWVRGGKTEYEQVGWSLQDSHVTWVREWGQILVMIQTIMCLVYTVCLSQTELFSSVQFNSVAQSCPTLCDPMDCSMPGLPVHHQLPEFTQTHVHHVSDAIQTSHPLPFPSHPTFNLSQHQGLSKWVSSSHQLLSFSVILSYSKWIVNSLFKIKEQGAKRKDRCCPTIRNFQGDLTFLTFACL